VIVIENLLAYLVFITFITYIFFNSCFRQKIFLGEKPYECSLCQKRFSTTISLKTHSYTHTGERPHRCPQCPKTFATSSKLSRHVVTHSEKRPYPCDLCPKTFNRSGNILLIFFLCFERGKLINVQIASFFENVCMKKTAFLFSWVSPQSENFGNIGQYLRRDKFNKI